MSPMLEGPDGNLERVPLRNQAQAVCEFISAALELLELAKTAAEEMDAEQAAPHMHAIRRPARLLMACRQGARETLAQWTHLQDELPRVAVVGAPDAEPQAGVVQAPNKCKACGGHRKVYSPELQTRTVCSRCKGTGKEPT